MENRVKQRFVLLQHCTSSSAFHWDLLLEQENVLTAWSLPSDFGSTSADLQMIRPLPDHRRLYLDYEGPISGNRGFVRQIDSGTYEQAKEEGGTELIRLQGHRFYGTLRIMSQSAIHLEFFSMETVLFFCDRKTDPVDRTGQLNSIAQPNSIGQADSTVQADSSARSQRTGFADETGQFGNSEQRRDKQDKIDKQDEDEIDKQNEINKQDEIDKTSEMERRGERERRFLADLRDQFDGTVYVLPHLYDCEENGPVAQTIRELTGPLTVYSWLSNRATFWLLRKRGLQNTDIRCYDLREETTTHLRTKGPARIVRIDEPTKRRWYPVLDDDACQGCLECVNYCMFGVYEIGPENQPIVQQPDACRDGCPACSRLCPAHAIIFPEYDDPMISGRIGWESLSESNQTPIPSQPEVSNRPDLPNHPEQFKQSKQLKMPNHPSNRLDSLDQLIDLAEE
ncbi:MAG: DNA polymerase ligase N-terminal domain-containing protein [Thermoguttaceae bacterium]